MKGLPGDTCRDPQHTLAVILIHGFLVSPWHKSGFVDLFD